MAFIKRNETGDIVAVSLLPDYGFDEELAADNEELLSFYRAQEAPYNADVALEESDREIIRVVEDLVVLLTDKGIIQFTELPDAAQNKMLHRRSLRHSFNELSELLLDGEDETIDLMDAAAVARRASEDDPAYGDD